VLTTDLLPRTPFTWPMARALGIPRHELARMVDVGEVRRVLRNVYVVDTVADSLEVRVAAAGLVISDWAVIRDRTAAWLWGVDTFEFRELEILPPIESCVRRGHTRTRRDEVRGGTRDLSDEDVVEMGSIAVTTPLRTALDLACHLRRGDALAALDGFMREHGLTHQQLRRELRRYFRRRGVVQARQLIALADPLAESPGESWTRMAMLDRGLPAPVLQHWVEDGGRRRYRLDMAYPKHRLAVEYDGRGFHTTPEQREHDRERRTWLEQQGWTVIVVTRDDFTPEAVDLWVLRIREALRLAA